MARFELQLPEEIMRDIQYINDNSENIFGKMTEAGANVVLQNIRANVPASFKDSNIMSCLKLTRVYKTPSDDGINTKVGFYGYFINKKNVKTPAPLVANVYEYGRSNAPFKKHPFLRKSFNKGQIESAMLKAQSEASGGLLNE